ncbi:MAG: MMPL family transporter, partial [Alphaproteobacteria bacterium]
MTAGLVAFCCRYAWPVALVALLFGVGSAIYVSQNFQINTNSDDLISANVPWRKLEAVYDKKFPQQNNLLLVVVDGATPELTHAAVVSLAAKLAPRTDVFLNAHRPTTDTFFERNGLLFLSLAEVKETTQKIINAQAFLGGLAVDPSVRGVMNSLDTALTGVDHDQAKLADLSRPMTAISDTLEQVTQGKQAFLSWQSLITGRAPSREELRGFIEVQPKLDYGALEPGAKASAVVRQAARDLGLTPDRGVRVRLTGPIPLADEEFSTLAERATLMTTAMLVAVLVVLWLAVRSFRIIFCIVATIAVGLVVTTAFGLIAVGVFNILSIAFIALFVGLGVD